jgi:hypothetical protein
MTTYQVPVPHLEFTFSRARGFRTHAWRWSEEAWTPWYFLRGLLECLRPPHRWFHSNTVRPAKTVKKFIFLFLQFLELYFGFVSVTPHGLSDSQDPTKDLHVIFIATIPRGVPLAVLWNCNYFLRFRFLLLKSYGSGSDLLTVLIITYTPPCPVL